MAEYDEEGVDVAAAAQILLSLRNRKLRRWPEWEEAEFDLPPVPEGWPKGRRSPLLVRASGAAWLKSLKDPFAQLGSGASSSGEDRAWSPAPVREKPKAARRAEMLPCYGAAAAGSGPSTSGGERARLRPRSSEKARAKVAAVVKEAAAMAATSPETPFDYGAAAGSGASSSGDERLRSSSPTKRKARRQSGSGGPSSGDEGCSSPAKRTRPDLNAGDGVTQDAAPAAVKVMEPPKIDEENCRDEKGHLLFDLNEDLNMSWEG
ncbi:uncharacterized protein LOC100844892 [Brachypodium distachyon]|uniref:Uncharacterized protein n=1 Tax=Brachypodium distachyon TaxID=15368 RepID=I1I2M3_BRADI|nr:uncharacterized protein LOC100844892 [Brachypodium distachyon]KQJ95946.1 hypothetical protein BRADI_3g19875v3 [Brachypodium distachyon]|eukprot:XP_010234550.1 uncharacterized protein LOC100844892 [Brachypodium distachyon]